MPEKNRFPAVLQPTAGTLGNRGLRSHTEIDGHGAYIPVAIQAGATRENPASGPDGIGVRTDGVAYTIEARAEVQAVGQPVPYDLFQITAPVNRQNRKPGDPRHTLARDNAAHAAVAFQQNTRDEVRLMNGDGQIAGALAAEAGMKQQNYLAQTTPAVAIGLTTYETPKFAHEVQPTLTVPSPSGGGQPPAVAFQQNQLGEVRCNTVAGTVNTNSNPSGRNTPMVEFNFQGGSQQDQILTGDAVCPALAHASNSHGGHHQPKVAQIIAPSLTATNDPSRSPQSSEVTQQVAAVHASTMTVRRLTPRECERLQGFPDDWTMIPYRGKPPEQCPDGPRYKALGNSMACNVMAWIGERIAAYENQNP